MRAWSRSGVVGGVAVVVALGVGASAAEAATSVKATGGSAGVTEVCGVRHRAVTVARGGVVRLAVARTGASRRSRSPVVLRIAVCRDGRYTGTVRHSVRTSRRLSTTTAGDYRVTLGGRSVYVRVAPSGTSAAPTAPTAPAAPGAAREGIHATRTTDGSQTLDGSLRTGSIVLEVTARRTAAGAVSGEFHASGNLASVFGAGDVFPIDFRGPVECLDAAGDQAALFYPLATASPEIFKTVFGGILITIQGDPTGGLGHVSFSPVPLPLATTVGCGHGGPAPLIVNGGSLAIGSPTG